ncbi:MAG: 3-oxoacyl-(Acyl-carrier protein) reductase [Candidatus Roizmanbacteria bacterium GW2011_GWA2_35_19]|uniref:3-oxoacyl-(Acyl-carrier protein) reductase n=2 Tax=Candidatus Roizmaniibacteriota TaxID=1752723 RepID=A0A0G0BTH6_9BACT|nr:MAG: 3-oxoacyl-(Acyl-carrier protein) reductase [Candidatus Roizmanbacteria bacterium GW2011_GWC2_35_12]KKP72724.1 MAG: 3-oxoacyl-(Acyl-carrier protein) reductase [Candidatus Roizmanbacteria bacterium GW2011_GWA2_35_19]
MKSNNKVALVTGSSRGIGRTIALKLHKEGFEVVVTYCYDKAAGEKVFTEINKNGLLLKLDGGNERNVKDSVEEFSKKYDHLDVLVVSGMHDKPHSFKKTSFEDWKFVLNSKLDSSFLVPKYFYQLLKKTKFPQIILNTSSVEEKPQIGALAYSVASAGVANLVKSLAIELAPEGFRINAICPGTTRTDNWIGFGLEDDNMWKKFADSNPMKRVPTPEDIAEAVSYLVSDKAKYINGLFLYVDGGSRHKS